MLQQVVRTFASTGLTLKTKPPAARPVKDGSWQSRRVFRVVGRFGIVYLACVVSFSLD